MIPTPGEWFTIAEAARELRRTAKTVRNRLYRLELPRRAIRGGGRRPNRIVVISRETLERLRQVMWPPPPTKKPRKALGK